LYRYSKREFFLCLRMVSLGKFLSSPPPPPSNYVNIFIENEMYLLVLLNINIVQFTLQHTGMKLL